MEARTRTRSALVAMTVVLACGGGEDLRPATEGTEAPGGREGGTVTVMSTGGTSVSLALPAGILRAGPMEVTVEVAPPEAPATSVDLASPTMPMHGVVRTPLELRGDRRSTATVNIPMEGRWALYVNLDAAGLDAAEFEFEVEPRAGHPTRPGG